MSSSRRTPPSTRLPSVIAIISSLASIRRAPQPLRRMRRHVGEGAMRSKTLGLVIVAMPAFATGAGAQGTMAAAPLAAQACAGCHGQAGAGSGSTPAIAGRDKQDFIATMRAFRADE